MKTESFDYKCQCAMCGDFVDASKIQVTVDYGDFYDAQTDELAHIEGLYVECIECIDA